MSPASTPPQPDRPITERTSVTLKLILAFAPPLGALIWLVNDVRWELRGVNENLERIELAQKGFVERRELESYLHLLEASNPEMEIPPFPK